MIRRAGDAFWALLRAIDILVCTLWLAPLYVLNLADKPSGRKMVSSYIGKASMNGHRWAKRAEGIINWSFTIFGGKPDHCRRAYLHYLTHDD